jgi:outer membrane protein TolC
MIRQSIALFVLVGCCGTVAAQDSSLDPDVEKILRERIAVLQEAANLQRNAYRSGEGTFHSTLAADQALREAQLEVAKNRAERVRIREDMLELAETLERSARQLAAANQGTRMDLLSARAHRLRATADLMLERKAARISD